MDRPMCELVLGICWRCEDGLVCELLRDRTQDFWSLRIQSAAGTPLRIKHFRDVAAALRAAEKWRREFSVPPIALT
jgi:hypothetical protein